MDNLEAAILRILGNYRDDPSWPWCLMAADILQRVWQDEAYADTTLEDIVQVVKKLAAERDEALQNAIARVLRAGNTPRPVYWMTRDEIRAELKKEESPRFGAVTPASLGSALGKLVNSGKALKRLDLYRYGVS